MSISFSQTASLACPQCNTRFDDDVWLVIDTQAKPDLLNKVLAGNLHVLPCPQCDHQGGVDAPVLLYRPDEEPTLIFSSADSTSAEEDREHIGGLLGYLKEEMGESWQENWATQMASVPRWLLPVFLQEGAEAALHMAQEQAETELAQLKENDPQAYQKFEEEVIEEKKMPPLFQDIQAFIFARSWEESRQYLQQHPELLEDGAFLIFEQLIAAAEEEGEEETRQMFMDHRNLLQRCREIGIADAFGEGGH